ncbi:MAG TPA: TMEM165/GDT1 family protein [Streptosporangiaceae bacterium]|nr:TMEM165/GDT1 family protein [Streptosporangiaceae bacterium]
MNFAVAATTFGLVFPAELPDKTALASLMLGSRYRPIYVFTGVAAAFAVHVLIALVAGGLLTLLPHRVVSAVIAILFGLGAVVLIRGRNDVDDEIAKEDKERPPTFLRVALTSFAVIFIAEFGDLTQILIVNLSAKYHDPLSVGVGSWLALIGVGALALAGGRGLLKVIPARTITLIGAFAMAVLAVVNLVNAFRG